jgi:plasmid replication initiation protein
VEISIGKKKRFVNWLNYVEYEEGQGEVSICFNKQLKPYLLQLKANFTQYQLAAVVNFKSAYSIRFYEFLKMRQNQGKGGQFFIRYTIFDLRDILGIASHEYPDTKNLRVRVIEPALKEINTQSDLAIVDVQYVKQGRSINEIIIYAESKKQRAIPIPKQPENTPVEKEIHPIIEALMSFGFSFELAKSFKIKHGIKKIERNIAYAIAKKQAGEVKNMPAYLSKAIEEDWGNAWETEKQLEREKIQKNKQREEQEKLEKEELSKQLTVKNNAILDSFYALSPENRNELISDFFSWVGTSGHKSMKPRFEEILKEFGEKAIKTNPPLRSIFLTFLQN